MDTRQLQNAHGTQRLVSGQQCGGRQPSAAVATWLRLVSPLQGGRAPQGIEPAHLANKRRESTALPAFSSRPKYIPECSREKDYVCTYFRYDDDNS